MLPPELREELLARLPLEPPGVVARAMALDPETRPLGEGGAVLLHPSRRVAHQVAPMGGAELVRLLEEAGWPRFLTFAGEGEPPELDAAGYSLRRLALHALLDLERVPPFVGSLGPPPRILALEDLPRLEPLPQGFQRRLERALERDPPVPAVVLHGRVVSFASARWCGDLWWDLSADTLPAFRRKGFATACAVALIQALAPRGLRSVNAPETGGDEVRGFLTYLGFQDGGTLLRWSRGETGGPGSGGPGSWSWPYQG